MKWPLPASLLCTAALLAGSFYLLQHRPVATFISANGNTLTNLNSIILVATVFSLLFAIFTYYAQRYERKKTQKENCESLVQNAIMEVEMDLAIIKFAEDHFKEFQTIEGGLPSSKLLFFSLQEIIGIVRSREIRENILTAIAEMDKANQVIDTIVSYRGPTLSVKQMSSYMKMREVNLGKFKEIIAEARARLYNIKIGLSKKDLEFLE